MMANPILDKISKLNAEIEQLRAENSHLRRAGMDRPSAELHEAALAELRAENDHLKQARSDALAGGDALREEIIRLRARVGDLTDALIDARYNGLIYWSPMTERGAVERAAMMARIDKVLNKEAKP
jgi:hypothetical protein